MPKSEVFCADCLPALRNMPDKSFSLCVADPPYGINVTGRHRERERERERRSSSAAPDAHSGERATLYGKAKSRLSSINFIPCSTTAPRRTQRFSGSWNVSVRNWLSGEGTFFLIILEAHHA